MLKSLFGRNGGDDDRPRKIIKAEKKITNMYIQRGDRQYFLGMLRDEGTDAAARALTKRFTCSCDNTTVDRDEKELTAHLLVEMGGTALEPVKDYIRNYDSGVNWPFRALRRMLEQDALVDFLVEVLESIGPDYVREPERKEQLVLIAKDFPEERLTRALLPYLDDDNETIRYVAAETVIHHATQGDAEVARKPLSDRLVEEISTRVTAHIARAFAEHGWVYEPTDPAVDPAQFVPDGFKLTPDRKLVAR